MKNSLQWLCALTAGFSLTANIHGQGTAFTYQGQLNVGGATAHGNYDLIFQLFSAATNGAPGPSVTNLGTGVTNGLFTVSLDFGPNVFPGSNNWVQISARAAGGGSYTNLAPLLPITPAPYALSAGTAAALSGTVANSNISGVYTGAVTFNNISNIFAGDGSGLAGVWLLGGNAGTAPGTQFLGTTDSNALELHVNGQRAFLLDGSVDPRFPNITGGSSTNAILGAITAATISGGFQNTIEICGNGTIAGGVGNTVSTGNANSISGGQSNIIQNESLSSTIAGGNQNMLDGSVSSFIGAGFANEISSSLNGTVGGGYSNTVTAADFGVVGGGNGNTVTTAQFGFVGGGYGNIVSGEGAAIAGGGYDGGSYNGNVASGNASFIGGGMGNASTNHYGVVTGGFQNTNGGNGAVIGGGGYDGTNFSGNLTYGSASVISGGSGNQITSNAPYATIAGGESNQASAGFTFVAGRKAHALHTGAFVYADSQNSTFSSTNNNSFNVRAEGGVVFTDGNALSVSWTPGNASWNFASDQNLKEKLAPVNDQAVLEKISKLPVKEWNYKGFNQRHIGAMAQDFHQLFPFNDNDKVLNDADLHGVELAAIKGLNQKLETENKALRDQVSDLEARFQKLEEAIKAGGTVP